MACGLGPHRGLIVGKTGLLRGPRPGFRPALRAALRARASIVGLLLRNPFEFAIFQTVFWSGVSSNPWRSALR